MQKWTMGPVAKLQKGGAKPMEQDVHVGSKISNGAAQAAPAIVNCPLSIVNFLGFAITSIAKLVYC
jgi:hypothetical protein